MRSLPLAVHPSHFQLLVTLQPLMHSLPLAVYTPHSRLLINSQPPMRSLSLPFVLVASVSHSRHALLLSVCQCILVFVLRLNFEFLLHTSATSFSYSTSSLHSHITAIYPFNLFTIRPSVLPTLPPLFGARHLFFTTLCHLRRGGGRGGRRGVGAGPRLVGRNIEELRRGGGRSGISGI